ncbi:hypothetical protein CLF_113145 [Clonorchis sinensis]|uniref:Uncharacterized protein n=1 Tax=Clonorchis sinensis TaxID=79923 RepID=G7YXR3_CLOSI|nr:hypothetical protein CLF_113145 [Clonorchis sinensis]
MTEEICHCLKIGVSKALVGSGGNIGLVMLMVQMVLGRRNYPAKDELLTVHRLRWLGHVIRMPVNRLHRRARFALC